MRRRIAPPHARWEGGAHGSNESVKLATPSNVDEKKPEKGTEFLYMWLVLILDSD